VKIEDLVNVAGGLNFLHGIREQRCTCGGKSPLPHHHEQDCGFRKFVEQANRAGKGEG
jgi:hypothetical protein